MRVVAGSAGGRHLLSLPGETIRPTSDRVREAVFNALHSRAAVAGAAGLDLFAGTGALGIEALSRGADRMTFVDNSLECTKVVEANLAACGLADRAEVVVADGPDWLNANPGPWDLVLLDPPYAFDGWVDLLGGPMIRAVAGKGTVVVESNRRIETGQLWNVGTTRRYGSTVVTLLTPTD
ncbi:MAG: RsmD family RNA methyltransferase [Actinomycetota bacterium]|nr:RsmD family RNA methyltransferase [Actinomycetota bacterium]